MLNNTESGFYWLLRSKYVNYSSIYVNKLHSNDRKTLTTARVESWQPANKSITYDVTRRAAARASETHTRPIHNTTTVPPPREKAVALDNEPFSCCEHPAMVTYNQTNPMCKLAITDNSFTLAQ